MFGIFCNEMFFGVIKTVMAINQQRGNLCTITDVVFFEPSYFSPHNSQPIDANTDATNTTTTTMTTHIITYQYIPTRTNTQYISFTHLSIFRSPAQIQVHFIRSGTRLAQKYLNNCFLHGANMFIRQRMGQGTCTLAFGASQGRV